MSTKPVNVEDYRILAQRRLPKIIVDYLEGGADDEIGTKHNREVFERYRLMPRPLVDVSKRYIGIELFGRHQAAPFMIGPTGLNGALWPKGDILLARAAQRAKQPRRAGDLHDWKGSPHRRRGQRNAQRRWDG
jgi:(S)-mandelate dehydrogenase